VRRNPQWGAIRVTLNQASGCDCTRFNLVAILGAITGPEELFCKQRARTHRISEHIADLPAEAPARTASGAADGSAQAGAEELDATIRRNLEVLGYGE